ncbi:MAG: thiamine pyrophosphate-binding protein [Deltaproteobacteria bacterium]|nr:thiamine pyrophosphate-binding protein [Deltaproteobacteria bacterium]
MMTRTEALQILAGIVTDQPVICGHTAREWNALTKRPLNLWSGAMGMVSSMALGVALQRPDRQVWAFDGDGALLMNLGSLVTITQTNPPNLVHFVFDNRVYQASGEQPVPGAEFVDFAALARAAGFRHVYSFEDAGDLRAKLREILLRRELTFIVIRHTKGEGAWGDRDPYRVEPTVEKVYRFKRALEER